MRTIVDSSVKSGCCLLSIHEYGYSTLFENPEGFLLSPSSHMKKDLLVFMENMNAHKAIAGLVAVLMSCAPQHIVKGAFIPHEIVLIQGLVLNLNQQYMLVYHKWLNCHDWTDLYDLIGSDLSNTCMIDQLFDQEPCMIAASDAYVMYFNQISGISHHSFSRYVSTFRHSSEWDVFQSSLLQDNWCMGMLRSKIIASNYNFLRFIM